MIYKNSKDIYSKVSVDTGFDEELVSSIGKYVYSNIRSNIENLTYREMYILGLGSFRFKINRGRDFLQTYERFIKTNIKITDRRREEIEFQIQRHKVLISEYEEILNQRDKLKYERDNKHIQEQESDLGGVEEQSI